MQKVLRKRVLRDLKANLFRYLALGLMIAMGIFLVVTIVGSAETMTKGTEDMAEETNLEDGEFEVFVPLSEKDVNKLSDMGADIEDQFYFDYVLDDEDKSTVRIFRVRDKINRIHYVEGNEPAEKTEIVIEKRYAEEHGLKTGDSFEMAGVTYRISGIGVVSDYDGPQKALADTACNSKAFGPVFVTGEAYEAFRRSGKAQKSETYLYAYKLGKNLQDADLKKQLKDFTIDASEVDDALFREYWDRTGGVAESLESAVDDLSSATKDVRDGLKELSKHNVSINDATEKLFDTYLSETNKALENNGIRMELTADNYEKKLDELIGSSDNAILKLTLENTIMQLSELEKYRDGLLDYTEGVDELYEGTDEMADGVSELDTAVTDALDEFDIKLSNMTMFLTRADNPRIFATKNDKLVDIEVGVVAGVILFILLAYVISVFVVHSIESESSIIGTLYSMGVTRNDLLTHYITLPVVVTFLAGLAGVLVASTGIMAPMIAESSYSYFSIPRFDFKIPAYLWVYSLAVPPLVAVIVNVLVIRSKLSRSALSLIRNEAKQGGIKKVNLKGVPFVSAFRIRQMLRELRSTLAVVLGMFLALLIFMIGVDCFVLCDNIAKDYADDTKFEYMYTLKYPEEKVPEGAEAAYAYTCKKKAMGYNFDVTILGIDDYNPYFNVKPGDSKVDVVITSSFAEKFGLKKGEEFVVTDEEKELKYAFSVKDITEYSTSFYIFMDIDVMRDMMGEADDYYNVLFTKKKLDIDPGRVYATTSRDDVVNGASVFSSLMMPMVFTLSFAAIVIFCVVMYLMVKVMIDRSAYNISLIKVFGYRRKEIRRLYLDGNFYIVALGALICIPLSKTIMNHLFPFMISNVTCGLNVKTPFMFYVVTYVVILLLYLVINTVLVKRLNKFTPAEVLKNRE